MNSVLLTIAKEAGNTVSRQQLFNPDQMSNIKADGTAVSFVYFDTQKKEYIEFTTGTLTLASLTAAINTSSPAGAQLLIGVIDTAVSGSTAIGVHDVLDTNGNPVYLPNKTRIWDSYYEVVTTFTSATDAATISIDIATDDVAGIKAATAISTGTTYDATGAPVALIPQGTVATVSEKTTGIRKLQYTVAVEALTAGKLYIYANAVTGL